LVMRSGRRTRADYTRHSSCRFALRAVGEGLSRHCLASLTRLFASIDAPHHGSSVLRANEPGRQTLSNRAGGWVPCLFSHGLDRATAPRSLAGNQGEEGVASDT
jgi:hypothetical protein